MLKQIITLFLIGFLIWACSPHRKGERESPVPKSKTENLVPEKGGINWPDVVNDERPVQTKIEKGKNYVQFDLAGTQYNLDFFTLSICKNGVEKCESKEIFAVEHTALLPMAGIYNVTLRACFTDHTCQVVQKIENFRVEAGSPRQVAIAERVDELHQEAVRVTNDISNLLGKIREKEAKNPKASEIVKSIDSLASLTTGEELELFNNLSLQLLALEQEKEVTVDERKDSTPTGSEDPPINLIQTILATSTGLAAMGSTSFAAIGYSHYLRTGLPVLNVSWQSKIFEGNERLPDVALADQVGARGASGSMFVSENLGHYNAWLEEQGGEFKDRRLIVVEAAQTSHDIALSPEDKAMLQASIEERLRLYESINEGEEGRFQAREHFPLLAVPINTGGVHWETIIVDLNDLNEVSPRLDFEHWEFTGQTAPSEKIQMVKDAIYEALLAFPEERAILNPSGTPLKAMQISELAMNTMGDDKRVTLRTMASEPGRLRQQSNNCGPASSWIIEQRMRGFTPANILQMDTEGFWPYRDSVLRQLRRSRAAEVDEITGRYLYPVSSVAEVEAIRGGQVTIDEHRKTLNPAEQLAFDENVRRYYYPATNRADFEAMVGGKRAINRRLASLEGDNLANFRKSLEMIEASDFKNTVSHKPQKRALANRWSFAAAFTAALGIAAGVAAAYALADSDLEKWVQEIDALGKHLIEIQAQIHDLITEYKSL